MEQIALYEVRNDKIYSIEFIYLVFFRLENNDMQNKLFSFQHSALLRRKKKPKPPRPKIEKTVLRLGTEILLFILTFIKYKIVTNGNVGI